MALATRAEAPLPSWRWVVAGAEPATRPLLHCPAYAGFEVIAIPPNEFRSRWLPGLERDGLLVGLNWSGKNATGLRPRALRPLSKRVQHADRCSRSRQRPASRPCSSYDRTRQLLHEPGRACRDGVRAVRPAGRRAGYRGTPRARRGCRTPSWKRPAVRRVGAASGASLD